MRCYPPLPLRVLGGSGRLLSSELRPACYYLWRRRASPYALHLIHTDYDEYIGRAAPVAGCTQKVESHSYPEMAAGVIDVLGPLWASERPLRRQLILECELCHVPFLRILVAWLMSSKPEEPDQSGRRGTFSGSGGYRAYRSGPRYPSGRTIATAPRHRQFIRDAGYDLGRRPFYALGWICAHHR